MIEKILLDGEEISLGGSEEVWEDIIDYTFTEDVGSARISTDINGNTFALKKFQAFIIQEPIVGQTVNNVVVLGINNAGYGNESAIRIKSSPKESENTVYSYLYADTLDGKFHIRECYVSSNYGSIREILTESVARNFYDGANFRKRVDTNTNTLRANVDMPCTSFIISGITSIVIGKGSRIIVKGVRAQ